MKKINIIFLVLSLFLFSAQASEKVNIDDFYVKGMNSYKDGDFANSYEMFSKIYLKKLSDVKFNFYFGRSAYETGYYENAIAAFERVEILDAGNLRNKVEMGRTYFMLKMYQDAENAFKDVLANQSIPQNIRTNLELALSRVSKVQQKSFTYATVMLDVLYDSNINYGSIEDYYYAGGTLKKVAEVSDIALQANAKLVNIYDIGDKNGFSLKNTLSAYVKNYTSYDDYDLNFFSYTPSLLYQETHFTTELLLGIDTLTLGEKSYLSSIYIQPRLEFNHSPTTRSLFYAKYQSKKFKQKKQHNLDASRYELAYGLQDILSPRSFIQGNVIGIIERKKRGDNIYVDFDEIKVNAKYTNQYTVDYSLDLFAQLKGRTYKDYSNGFESIREEVGGFASVDLTIKLMNKLNFKLSTSYDYMDSNQDRFSYKKHTASAGLVKTF